MGSHEAKDTVILTGPQPMELDANDKYRTRHGISQEERDRRQKQKLCYGCGKPGHFRGNCPQKKQRFGGKPQQLKVASFNQEEPARLSATLGRSAYDTTGTIKGRTEPMQLSAVRVVGPENTE